MGNGHPQYFRHDLKTSEPRWSDYRWMADRHSKRPYTYALVNPTDLTSISHHSSTKASRLIAFVAADCSPLSVAEVLPRTRKQCPIDSYHLRNDVVLYVFLI